MKTFPRKKDDIIKQGKSNTRDSTKEDKTFVLLLD